MKLSIKGLLVSAIILNIQGYLVICANDKFDSVFKGALNITCNKKMEDKAENLMQILVPVGTDQRVPETPKELRKYCNLANKNMPFILGVLDHCSNPFARTIAKFIIFPIRKQLDSVCKVGKLTRSARELITAGKCGNLARKPLEQCNNNIMDAMSGISIAPVKSRLYMLCCHSNAFRLCLREAAEETVGCTRHSIDFIENFILKAIGGSITLVCGEYFDESDKCTKLMDQTPKSQYNESSERPKSILMPLMKLMESFPDLDENVN